MRSTIVRFVAVALVVTGSILPNAALAQRKAKPVAVVTAAPAISVTPPAPVVTDAERWAELAGRRERVANKIGANGVLVLYSGEPRVYTNDVEYEFRAENNLYYLTNLNQKRARLVVMPGNTKYPAVLFIPKRDPAAETWTGHMYSPEEAAQISGVKEIWDFAEFEEFLRALQNRQSYEPKNRLMSADTAAATGTGYESLNSAAIRNEAILFLLLPRDPESREYKAEQTLASQWSRVNTGYAVRNAFPIFTELRLRKSPLELKYMQHAMDISTEAHERAQAAAMSAKWEYEVEAEVDYTFRRRNADNWGYPNIVGCGPNATTLHYEESQGRVTPGQLMLMDVGAEYQHYTADVTRTFPVNGKFSPEQAAIYQIVYDAQEAAARATKPGATLPEVHNAAEEVIKDGLLRLGLITDKNSQQFRVWFMHGNSHWLGMNVHDLGTSSGQPPVKLAPGMVFTNEPGIYVREDALDVLPKTPENEAFIAAVRPAFEKFKGTGVRIEDDMLVTETGTEWMTKALPRSIADIEAFLARVPREVHAAASRRPMDESIAIWSRRIWSLG
ncbi:MAG: aminopeptidase P family protein [Pyrinomonadaceae bacterium]